MAGKVSGVDDMTDFLPALLNRVKPSLTFVTPAKAGVHHRHTKSQQPVMDSRLRGNDELVFGKIGFGREQRI
jgi:hypothetical protein